MESMFKTIRFFSLLLFISLFISSCEDNSQPDIVTEFTIEMITSDADASFAKSMVLYEDDNYIIKAPLDSFIVELGGLYADNYDSYEALAQRLTAKGETCDSLNVKDYFYEDCLDDILGYFLENGQCHIKDKNNDASIPKIKKKNYSDLHDLSGGEAGKRFYIDDQLFLEIVEWED